MNLIVKSIKCNHVNPSSMHGRSLNIPSILLQEIIGQISIGQSNRQSDKEALIPYHWSKEHSKSENSSHHESQSMELIILNSSQRDLILDLSISHIGTHYQLLLLVLFLLGPISPLLPKLLILKFNIINR